MSQLQVTSQQDLEDRIEAIFDKADDLMINKRSFKEAVRDYLNYYFTIDETVRRHTAIRAR